MFFILFLYFFNFNFYLCDWIEIPQVTNNKYSNVDRISVSDSNYRPNIITKSDLLNSILLQEYQNPSIELTKTFLPNGRLSSNNNYYGLDQTNKNSQDFDDLNVDRIIKINNQNGYMVNTSDRNQKKIIPRNDFVNVTTTIDGTMGSYLEKISDSYFDIPLRRKGIFDDSNINIPENITATIKTQDTINDGITIEDEEYEDEVYVTMRTTTKIPKIAQQRKTAKLYKLVPLPAEKKNGVSASGFIDFLKYVQNSFVTKTARNIKEKIKMLTVFKDKLLINIEDHIKFIWPTKVVRTKRGLLSGDSHMDFPSAEGALMTICFLTFAVFLIKLVLQVINTIKSKHYSYNGFEQSSMAAVKVIKRQRNARKFSYSENNLKKMANILSSIEKLKAN